MIRLEDTAILCVNLVGILLPCGIELQNIAGLARIAVELLPGEHDLLRSIIKSCVLQGDLLRLLQEDKFGGGGSDLIAGLIHDHAQDSVDFVSPASGVTFEDEVIVGRLDAAGNQLHRREDDLHINSGIVQRDFLRVGERDELSGVNDAAVLLADLVVVQVSSGVEL